MKTYKDIQEVKSDIITNKNAPYPRKNKMILSISADSKTIKGVKYGYLTGILYLAPADLSGVSLCPFSLLAGCEPGCLNTSGRGAFSNVQYARLVKAMTFNHDRKLFMQYLVFSIKKLIKQAAQQGLIPVVRPNGTTDIQWEKRPVEVDGVQYENIMQAFPTVQFYDYTKIPTRSNIPSNYDLTFSYSGVKTFEPVWQKALKNLDYKRFAVVFSNRDRMPTTFKNMPVVDGDNSDLRFNDQSNVIVGLYAKGKAKKDNSGFVVNV
jgi:hypothetical protein